ncbi:MAG: SDR family oxidoreductase [Microcoleus sp. PH2017_22_RUC_O_B]|uniref:SDR family oxidoreductase n=1 Tax=unclassified Microcoleus TaxID=2642155 RepID=UPI001DB0FFEE|nr:MULTISPECIES: SDR family oxidoreductase [unclassified Microcoleus]MCC3530901.1 SDR family oxidoreductase [Microcoleus sp. PH2017_21_RUC_O_A]MCC3541612.1 SDR family oxidoreductase [Microcoleus sp. PH2017_22_RUC_O_B]
MTKLIVITGVSRGLGLAMTQKFIELGHTVLGCARSVEAVEQLKQKYSAPNHFTCVDVANDEQVKAWATKILASYLPPDLLINNAAITNYSAPLWNISSEEFSQVIDVNIKGTANVIRHFVPAMIARKSGIIVNFSSGWGRSTSPEVAPYCASKWAIEGLTRSLAQELPRGMAAIPLNPGIIHTDMLEISFGAEAASYTPVKAWVQKAVPFLLKLKPSDNGMPMTVPG